MTKAPLDPEEYVEQGYLFELLGARHAEQLPMQELLGQVRYELLTTTRLPMAVSFLQTELRHSGQMSPAMFRLSHYFTSFQSFLVAEAEKEVGRFSMGVALEILEGEAKFRALKNSAGEYVITPEGLFFYHFETICRNRLSYDRGLTSMASDPIYNDDWSKWILMLRGQIGLVDLADLIFLASDEYVQKLRAAKKPSSGKGPFLFGQKEGRIAFGNRGKDPLFLFAAMQRHLGYPSVPRPTQVSENEDLVPQMARRIERLESRIKILEEEQRGGIDLSKFFEKPSGP